MSANQSNLSNAHYGYDMVVATTEASVNATMEEWLSQYFGGAFTQAYVYNPDTKKPALTDFDALKKDIEFDPFTIPNETPTTDPNIQKLLDKKFMFAFQIEIGIPDFPLEDIPPVIVFDKEGAYVTYNMVCKTFKVIVIQPELYDQTEWLNLSQEDSDKPWVFSFTVDLDLQSDDINNHFHNLPPATQQAIKNLGQEMFSVKQLFLDLNTAGLSDTVPTIGGLDPTSLAYVTLTEVFLHTYLAELGKNGGIMLGLGVVSHEPFPDNVSVIPTNLNFEVCSYKDTKGKPTTDYSAYTLNYLIMSKGRPMPAPAQFTWNWVEANNIKEYAGTMAVNRTAFVAFLHGLLSETLGDISRQPTTNFHASCIKVGFRWGFTPDTGPHSFNTVANGGSHVLTYTYSNSASHHDGQYCGLYYVGGSFSVDYTAQSDVYLEGTTIRVETTLNMHCRISVEGGVTSGNFARYSSTMTYTIGVDAYGRLSVSKSEPDITDHSEKVDADPWSKFVTLGQINTVVRKIRNSLQSWLQNYLKWDANHIANMLNGSSTWVFPGGKTFTFKDVAFSDNQDLVAHVLYVAPSGN